MVGFECPECGSRIRKVTSTIRSVDSVIRYRKCQCGYSLPTVEIPTEEYKRLRKIVRDAGIDPDFVAEIVNHQRKSKREVQRFKTKPSDFLFAFRSTKRRARKAGVIDTLAFEDVERIIERDECKCVRCGSVELLQLEHLMPISRGGANSIDNVCLMCQDCNFSKGPRMPLEWISAQPGGV